jgi:Flp pilus assembly protein TadG
MAIAMPVLLILMFGSAEVGNYFVNEHSLVKAVRDGARFAGRQSMSNYTACSGTPGGTVVADTRNVVINGYYSASDGITPNIKAADITVTYDCVSQANSVDMKGIYKTRASICGGGALGCAQRVTVSATVNYKPILSSFGFSGLSITLNASEQAAVMGI